jgi:hypothetical protein
VNKFNIIMVSAWHEQFGNGMLRMLDGHPNLYAYPFESQISTPLSSNMLAGPNHWVPQRYSYPEFPSEITPESAYQSIWDQELKTYLRTPHLSKFKDCGIVMSEKERIKKYVEIANNSSRFSRASLIEAFYRSTFAAWDNYPQSGAESHYVGYSPPIVFDADKFFSDFPDGNMVHVIRNPFSGYADTIKRPFPFSLAKYCQIWNATQVHALVYSSKYAGRFHIVYAEDIFENPKSTMSNLLAKVGLPWNDSALAPSFAGKAMEQVYPWGTVKYPTTAANIAAAVELNKEQRDNITIECEPVLDLLKYKERFDY